MRPALFNGDGNDGHDGGSNFDAYFYDDFDNNFDSGVFLKFMGLIENVIFMTAECI